MYPKITNPEIKKSRPSGEVAAFELSF